MARSRKCQWKAAKLAKSAISKQAAENSGEQQEAGKKFYAAFSKKIELLLANPTNPPPATITSDDGRKWDLLQRVDTFDQLDQLREENGCRKLYAYSTSKSRHVRMYCAGSQRNVICRFRMFAQKLVSAAKTVANNAASKKGKQQQQQFSTYYLVYTHGMHTGHKSKDKWTKNVARKATAIKPTAADEKTTTKKKNPAATVKATTTTTTKKKRQRQHQPEGAAGDGGIIDNNNDNNAPPADAEQMPVPDNVMPPNHVQVQQQVEEEIEVLETKHAPRQHNAADGVRRESMVTTAYPSWCNRVVFDKVDLRRNMVGQISCLFLCDDCGGFRSQTRCLLSRARCCGCCGHAECA